MPLIASWLPRSRRTASTFARSLTLALALSPAAIAFADVKPASIFGTHMVLQQGLPLPVWGTAEPGEKVTVTLADKSAEATADDKGHWKATLPAVPASDKPVTMKINGKNEVVFEDVMIGEVWVASGQSNMVATMRDMITKEIGDRKRIRFFKIPNTANVLPQESVKGEWVVCEPKENGRGFSAAAFYFAASLESKLSVPVGVIEPAWSGSAIMPWIDLTYVQQTPQFARDAAPVIALRERLPQALEEYRTKTLPEFEIRLQKWKDEQQAAKSNGGPAPAPADARAKKNEQLKPPTPPDQQSGLPSAMHNAMVHPLIPYAIKGFLWYQGESNAGRAKEYAELLPLLIKSLRGKWGQGDFPFLYVQLPAYTRGGINWAGLRQAQLETLSVPNTGMAIILDLNPTDNLHPPDKSEVGKRLALLALRMSYGKDVVASGPLYASSKAEGNKLRVTFTETGTGLTIGQPPERYRRKPAPAAPAASAPAPAPEESAAGPGASGTATNTPAGSAPEKSATAAEPHPGDNVPTDRVVGFEIAGADGVFHPATATIVDATTIELTSDAVTAPTDVRYAWAAYPHSNLYNKEGLPASPFSSKGTRSLEDRKGK